MKHACSWITDAACCSGWCAEVARLTACAHWVKTEDVGEAVGGVRHANLLGKLIEHGGIALQRQPLLAHGSLSDCQIRSRWNQIKLMSQQPTLLIDSLMILMES
jgi:hypothetical protein